MPTGDKLDRFLAAQADSYGQALTEIRAGRKRSHWMWYVFPQLAGLGISPTAAFYAIRDREEAEQYLSHPVLGPRLTTISQAMLAIDGKSAYDVLSTPDDLKLHSCMTLFSLLPNADPVFQAVLDKYFDGRPDSNTLRLLGDE